VLILADDFGDNGEVLLSARVRAMPSSFFVLQRLLVRVDGVLVRVIDTRVYHAFGSTFLVRERTVREMSTNELERRFGVEPVRSHFDFICLKSMRCVCV
jgi:type 2A phosphatase activator TIP41